MSTQITDKRLAEMISHCQTGADMLDGPSLLGDLAAALRELQEFRQIQRVLRDQAEIEPVWTVEHQLCPPSS